VMSGYLYRWPIGILAATKVQSWRRRRHQGSRLIQSGCCH
jgi:hypothetical protein